MTTAEASRTPDAPMTFLEAHRLVSNLSGGKPLSLLLGMSGTAVQLEMYVRGAAAKRGFDATVRTLPFNTLAQTFASAPASSQREVFVLCP